MWWACYIRDHLLALGLRRPIRLRPEDFNVPMLTLSDFEIPPLNDDVVRWLGPLPIMDDTPAKETLYITIIELAKLCLNIGDILSSQYSVLNSPGMSADRTVSVMVVPKKNIEAAQSLAKCDAALKDWFQGLEECCRYKAGQWSSADDQDGGRRIVYLHLAMPHMIYFTSITVLHRPRAFQSGTDPSDSSATWLSRDRVTNAAVRITEMIYDLSTHDSLRFASTSSITAILSATLMHLVNLRSAQEDVRSISIGRFYQP